MNNRECGVCADTVPVSCNFCPNCGEMHDPVFNGELAADGGFEA